MSCFRLAISCLALLLWEAPALAHTVALLQPPLHAPSTTELLERLRGELLSVGFEVVPRERGAPSESTAANAEAWQQALAAEGEVDAAIDVVGEDAPFAVDVWIIDGTHRFRLIARVALETNTESAARRLAIRASEVLRAHLFETHLGAAERRPALTAPPSTLAVEPANEPNPRSQNLGFELGATALASMAGVGPAILPVGQFDWAVDSAVVLQTTLAAFGTRPTIATSAGNARVAMQYGLFGGCYRLNWNRLKPFGALSAGALRTAVDGSAASPRQGHSVEQWSFLLDGSLGLVFELARHYSVTLAAHAQLAQPYVAIRFADQTVAAAGHPNLLMTLTLGVWP